MALPTVDILILLIPLSVVLALLIGAGFWWAVRSGQFDDLEGPAHRVVADDDSANGRDGSTRERGELTRTDGLTPVKPGDAPPR